MERNKIVLRLLLTHIFLVPSLIVLSFTLKKYSFLFLPITQCILLITFFTGYWEFFGTRFKWIYTVSLSAFIVFLLIMRLKEYKTNLLDFTSIVFSLTLAFLLFHLIKIIMVIFEKVKEPYEIKFLFKNGRYLITDGGNSKLSRLMNYHYFSTIHKKNKTNKSMLYATDLVKLSDSNNKFLPPKNEDYPIFNENIYSPMDGIVFKIVNDIPDNKPFSGNYPYNTGNTIVIKNNDYYFLLGHLKLGSIEVCEGDNILAGQLIAKIGNSGWTERPHLHMQLIKSDNENYWHGTGLPLKYNNIILYKNRIVTFEAT